MKTLPTLLWTRGRSWSAVVVGNTASRLVGFLFMFVAARALDANSFGLLSLAVATGLFWAQLTATGFPQALTRSLAVGADTAGDDIFVGLLLSVGVAVIGVLAVALVIAAQGGPTLEATVILAGLSVDAIYFSVQRGVGDISKLSLYRLIANIVQLLAFVAMVATGVANGHTAAYLWGTSYLVPIVLWEAIAPTRLSLVSRFTRAATRRQVGMAVPITIGSLGYGLLLNASTILLGSYWPLSEVARLGVGRTVTNVMILLPFGVTTVLMPTVAQRFHVGRDVVGLVWRAAIIVALVSAGLVAAIQVGTPGIDLLLGNRYTDIAAILFWQSVGMALYGTASVFIQSLIGLGRPGPPAAMTVLAGVLNLAFGVAFIPSGGAVVAAAVFAGCSALLLTSVSGSFIITSRHPLAPGQGSSP